MPLSWLQELEMQDQGFMNQYQMNNEPYYYSMEDFSVDPFSSDSCEETPIFLDQSQKCLVEPANIIKQPFDSINMKVPPIEKPKPKLSGTPNSFTISFGDVKPKDEFLSSSDLYGFNAAGKKNVLTTTRSPIQVQDHVLAERKRREKLAQLFISLSSLFPNLKKKDKANVLEYAANYILELKNRVKELERTMQGSVITSKRLKLSSSDDNGLSSNAVIFEENSRPCNPEIEVRTCGFNLLVEIYSRKNSISVVKVLNEMHKLGLSIISGSTMPFADTTLLVTIVAQTTGDFIMSSVDLVKNLQVVVTTAN